MNILFETLIGICIFIAVIFACAIIFCCCLKYSSKDVAENGNQKGSSENPIVLSESNSDIEFLASDITPEILSKELHTR